MSALSTRFYTLDNPEKTYWTKIFKRFCKPDATMDDLTRSYVEFNRYAAFSGKMMGKCNSEYGALNFFSAAHMDPFETIFTTMRGIKGASMDLRKVDEGLIREFEEYIQNVQMLPNVDIALEKGAQKASRDACTPAFWPIRSCRPSSSRSSIGRI